MKIVAFGVEYNSSNLGCQALSYSFYTIVDNIASNNNIPVDMYIYLRGKKNVKNFIRNIIKPVKKPYGIYKMIHFYIKKYDETDVKGNLFLKKELKNVDFVIDFTAGDSFSDIYGSERFFQRSYVKKSIIDMGIPFILGPQTIGPFYENDVQLLAQQILKQSKYVFARDDASMKRAIQNEANNLVRTTDVAFRLPYKQIDKSNDEIKKIGINVSGLLYSGGYTGENQFNLKVNYIEYSETIISQLLKLGYEVYLIPHVGISTIKDSRDNDWNACLDLLKKYPKCIISPQFKNAMDAKSYISSMDFFIGARMHSTIAATSTGVATIPFSYSTKFDGLYTLNGYEYCINGMTMTTQEAIEKTLEYVENPEKIREAVRIYLSRVNSLLSAFEKILSDLICQ